MGFKNSFFLKKSSESASEKERSAKAIEEDTLLLVDSDAEHLAHTSKLLERLGYRVFRARSCESALELVPDVRPILVLASMTLVGGDGYRLCQQLREIDGFEEVPFMFIMEKGEIPDKVVGHQSYATDYIQKPIAVNELQSRINNILKVRRRARARARAGKADEKRTPYEEAEAPRATPADVHVSETPPRVDEPISTEDKVDAEAEAPESEETALPEPQPVSAETDSGPTEVDLQAARQMGARENGDSLEDENPLFREAQLYVLEVLKKVEQGGLPDLEAGRRLAKQLAVNIVDNNELLRLAIGRRHHYSLNRHSVNVAILAIKVSQTMAGSVDETIRVGLAALLHEVGVVKLPPNLLHSEGRISPQELSEARRRAAYGAEILAGLGEEYEWLVQIVGQVFEREDGRGWPEGLAGAKIVKGAKIVGIADAFEACLHTRPYRKSLTGYQALFELTTTSAKSFSDTVIKALINSVSLYPLNEYVGLNTGEIGVVVETNPKHLSRPIVKLLYGRGGEKLEEPRVADLSKNPTLYITKSIPPELIPD